jgi:transketolase
MGLLDVGYFRGFTTVRGDQNGSPLCWYFQPAEAVAAYHCTRVMARLRGMCYMRTHRPAVPLIYDPDTAFEPGGFHVLATGGDLAVVTAGYMVHVARQAIERLAEQDVRATLVDAYSLPLDGGRLIETLQQAGGRALVVEDNYGGGLGGAVAEMAAQAGGVRVETLCCQRIPKSTRTPEEMLDYCGIGVEQVLACALGIVRGQVA